MPRYAVVAYPTMAGEDAAWIGELRRRFDPEATRRPAYVSLMFPLLAARDALEAHVIRCAEGVPAFALHLTSAVVHRDVGSATSLVYLLPDDGADEVRRLHDALYDGPFRRYLRSDLPYVPHLTICRSPDAKVCEALVAELRSHGVHVAARLEAIDLIEVRPGTLSETLARVPLPARPVEAGGA